MAKSPKDAADTSASAEPKHSGLIPFKPGQSGNPAGRTKGSRNKLGEAFITALHNDFQAHGVEVIETVRTERPHEYLKVVASLLPKQVEIKEGAFDGISDDDLAALVVAAKSALGIAGGGDGGTEQPGEPQSTH